TNLVRWAGTPDTVKAGTAVSLLVDQQGNVTGFVPSSADVSALHADLRVNQQQVAENTAWVQKALNLSQELKDSVESTRKTLADSQPALNAAVALQDQVTTLKVQLATQQTAHEQALALRDQQIATLTTHTQNLQNQLKTVDELRAQIQLISTRLPGAGGTGGTGGAGGTPKP